MLKTTTTKKLGNKVGRPKLPKGQTKAVITPIRFAADEKAIFEKLAKEQSLSLSEWVRKTLQNAVKR